MVKIMAVKDGVTSRMDFTQMMTDDGMFKILECGCNPESICNSFYRFSPDIVIVSEASYRKYACARLPGSVKFVIVTSHDQNPDRLPRRSFDRPPRSVCAVIADDIERETFRLVIMSVLSDVFAIQKNILDQIIFRHGKKVMYHSTTTESTKFSGFSISEFSESAAASDLPENIRFSEKELIVISYVANGLSNKMIAKSLFLSEGRVKNIISGILRKLNLAGRTQLAVYAINSGICVKTESAAVNASEVCPGT